MKVPKSIRDAYRDQEERYSLLKQWVDDTLQSIKDPRWHYESRVKELESYALKLETGRFDDPYRIEDFFACTLVVENLDSVSRAETLVRGKFRYRERRPRTDGLTAKPSDSFRFDDLRLYVEWKDDRRSRPSGLDGLLFEVQIKTFLQHAWSIATHNLIYKSDEKSWPKERIAFQVKAMLEHAETSIKEARKLAKSTSLKKSDALSHRITATVDLVNRLWPASELPRDRMRLAQNIDNLIGCIGIGLPVLENVLQKETAQGRGVETVNLSPYAIVVQSLLNQEPAKMGAFLCGPQRQFRVYLNREIEMPPSLGSQHIVNAILSP